MEKMHFRRLLNLSRLMQDIDGKDKRWLWELRYRGRKYCVWEDIREIDIPGMVRLWYTDGFDGFVERIL
jgi:hypothetical protein